MIFKKILLYPINYFKNFFQTNNYNMNFLWSGIKTIISSKNSNVNVINKLKDASGNITSESNVIANTFNDFFVSVGKNVTQKIPRTMKSPITYILDIAMNIPSLSPQLSQWK